MRRVAGADDGFSGSWILIAVNVSFDGRQKTVAQQCETCSVALKRTAAPRLLRSARTWDS